MSLTDKPLPMNQLCVAMVQDLGRVYENTAAHEQGDLNTVWESMYSKGLHRKVSSQCYYTPEEIEQARKKEEEEKEKKLAMEKKREEEKVKEQLKRNAKNENTDQKDEATQVDNEVFQASRDLASVHLERAMNSGRAHMHDEGRRYRKRTFSGSSENGHFH